MEPQPPRSASRSPSPTTRSTSPPPRPPCATSGARSRTPSIDPSAPAV
jgi:hypothetical protein